ncbi:MAG: phosphatidate cytidylyltransferase [Pseudomonadota bacterium]|jgi:phosphatidate cytidylyltransferase
MLKARVVTALILLAVFLAALLLLPDYGWAAFAAVVVGAAGWEWGGFMKSAVTPRALYAAATALAAFGLGMAIEPGRPGMAAGLYVAAGLLWVLAVPLWLARKWPLPADVRGWAVGWLVLLPACLGLVQLREFSPWFLLAAMALVWAADIAAYFTGRTLGRRKLAPAISPGKTWEGAVGAGIGVMIYGFAVAAAAGKLAERSVFALVAFALALLALTAVSIIGDLFESLMKRQAGLKDSGDLLPGHGGILDRIDSLTSTLPWMGLAVALREWWW